MDTADSVAGVAGARVDEYDGGGGDGGSRADSSSWPSVGSNDSGADLVVVLAGLSRWGHAIDRSQSQLLAVDSGGHLAHAGADSCTGCAADGDRYSAGHDGARAGVNLDEPAEFHKGAADEYAVAGLFDAVGVSGEWTVAEFSKQLAGWHRHNDELPVIAFVAVKVAVVVAVAAAGDDGGGLSSHLLAPVMLYNLLGKGI